MSATTHTPAAPTRHAFATRLIHAGLAIAIIVQLGSSQFMNPDKGGNTAFDVHEYAGLTAFAFVLGFWIFSLMRKRGTPVAELLPWTSSKRRNALWNDVRAHAASFRRFNLPAHQETSRLASAIHGLGLLLMTAMAASGTLYYFVNTGDPDAGGLVGAAMFVHKNLGNLVWAYLIGHAGFAVLNHFGKTMSLRTMWSFKR